MANSLMILTVLVTIGPKQEVNCRKTDGTAPSKGFIAGQSASELAAIS